MTNSGVVLCGAVRPRRVWLNWTLNAANWTDLVCQRCVRVWKQPARKEA